MFHKKSLAILLTCVTAGLFAQSNKTAYSLDFTPKKYTVQKLTVDGKSFTVRAYENIVYVKNSVDTAYQKMNIYIPEEYFKGKSINGYTAATAPVFFPNQIGGYMPATPASTKNRSPFAGMPPMNGQPPMGDKKPEGAMNGMPPKGGVPMGMMDPKQSAVLLALSKGYVVASAGARGRTTKDQNGIYTGKAPAVIVDLKAAVRYLKYNDKNMPGDANKIISNGTSAGGALSALLGATGNNPDYLPYLKALGAANTSDDIFAVSAYCPITNLDNADAAYEWQFYGVNTYFRGGPMQSSNNTGSSLSSEQISVSKSLKELFPAYVNSLKLKDKNGNVLTLDENGNGNFKELVKSYVITSAQIAIKSGKDLSKLSWLTIKNGKVTDLDFDAYVRYMQRQKTPPAFDALDLSTPETQEFGTAKIDKQHFTTFAAEHSAVSATIADKQLIKMMNPMNYIGTPDTKTTQHWRIRHGSKDKDTGLAISVILGTYLQNKGYDVNLELPWDKPHSGDYDLTELFQWTDSLCKK
jgi:hypothetical protein